MLIWAAERGNLAEVKRLITDCGINPNIQDVDGSMPLHVATQYGYPDVVELLLEYGADPNVKDNKGKTPLHIAAINNHYKVAKLLLEYGADPYVKDNKYGHTPLHYAVSRICLGNFDVVRLLLEHGADPNVRNDDGWTPLHSAASHCNDVAARILIDQGLTPP
jgi:cytohesin